MNKQKYSKLYLPIQGIKVNVRIFVPKDFAATTFDLAVILGNMIDNALEAVTGVEEKWINIGVKYAKKNSGLNRQNRRAESNSWQY